MRKIVAISQSENEHLVLCDDGTLWSWAADGRWTRMPAVPQDPEPVEDPGSGLPKSTPTPTPDRRI